MQFFIEYISFSERLVSSEYTESTNLIFNVETLQ